MQHLLTMQLVDTHRVIVYVRVRDGDTYSGGRRSIERMRASLLDSRAIRQIGRIVWRATAGAGRRRGASLDDDDSTTLRGVVGCLRAAPDVEGVDDARNPGCKRTSAESTGCQDGVARDQMRCDVLEICARHPTCAGAGLLPWRRSASINQSFCWRGARGWPAACGARTDRAA
jgi:hypothetical protein